MGNAEPNGVSQPGFDDSGWKSVGIPHSMNENEMFSNIRSGGEAPNGLGWYRKHFKLDKAYAGRKIIVEFEGAHMGAQVYINGKLIRNQSVRNPDATHVVGFLPFAVDISDAVTADGVTDNVIAVRVASNGDWFQDPDFSGAFRFGQGDTGIFRPVYMYVTDPVHIPLNVYPVLNTWGTHVSTVSIDSPATDGSGTAASANIQIGTNVLNESGIAQTAQVTTQIVDAKGKVVAQSKSDVILPPNAGPGLHPTLVTQNLTVDNPTLWYPNNVPRGKPYLYRVFHLVSVGGVVVDSTESPLGIRTITWDTNFPSVNGFATHLWGGSGRYDYPALGTAVPEEQQWRDLQLLANAGGNLYRPGHSSSSPEFLQAADALGIFVVQPSGDGENGFNDCYQLSAPTKDCPQNKIDKYLLKQELHREMIVRDRNNPSVLAWEANNGIMQTDFAKKLAVIGRTWDPINTRAQADRTPNGDNGDILSCTLEGCEVGVKHQFPNKPAWSAEYWGRGDFRENYDKEMDLVGPFLNNWRKGVLANAFGIAHWYLADEPGEDGFYWSGKTYDAIQNPTGPFVRSLGESMTDGNRFPRLMYYAYQAAWTPYNIKPVVHLANTWNRKGPVRVNAFSNCPAVRLMVNGVQQGGDQKPNTLATATDNDKGDTTGLVGQVHWDDVPWAPGKVQALCVDGFGAQVTYDGKPVIDEQVTAGAPHHIVLSMVPNVVRPDGQTFQITANGSDAAFVTAQVVDVNGVVVPDASNLITFDVDNKAVANYRGGWDHIVTMDKPASYHSPGDHELAAEGGLTRIAIRSTFQTGHVTVSATSPGLGAGTVSYDVKAPVVVPIQAATSAPQIVVPPASQQVSVGQPAHFDVSVSGAAPMQFQWQRDHQDIPGATGSSLDTAAATSADNGHVYGVRVRNAAGVVTSGDAVLSVIPARAVTIDTPPVAQTVVIGQTATFTVAVTGSPVIEYQWFRNDVAIDGAKSATYTTPVVTAADDGALFKVFVKNPLAQVTSSPVVLKVGAATAPTITRGPGDTIAALNQSATFTVEAEGSKPLHYLWTGPSGVVGGDSPTLTIDAVAPKDLGKYTVAVTNASGKTVVSDPATLSQAAPGVNLARGKRAFSASNQDPQGLPASNVTDGNVSSRWGSNQKDGDNASITVDLGAPVPINRMILRWEAAYASSYRIEVSNNNVDFVKAYESPAGFAGGVDDFTFPTITARYVRMVGQKRATAYGYSLYEIEVYDVPNCNDGSLYTHERYSVLDPATVRDNSSTLVWNRKQYTLTQAGAQFTQLAAKAWCEAQGKRLPTHDEALSIAGNNTAACAFPEKWTTWTSTIVPEDKTQAFLITQAGEERKGLIDNAPGWVLCVSGTPQVTPPKLTVQPEDVTGTVGKSAHFAVGIDGSAPITFKWYRVAKAGETNDAPVYTSLAPVYDTPPLKLEDNGSQYYVVASNASASVTSQKFKLTVTEAQPDPGNNNPQVPPPVIVTPPISQSASIGKTATFTVSATGTGALSYQWYRDGVQIDGAVAQSYTTPAVKLEDNGAQFTVLVSAGGASKLSDGATLNVVDGVPSNDTNLALNKTVTSTPVEYEGFSAATNVNDGDIKTRWASLFLDNPDADKASITIDLGKSQAVNLVRLKWEFAYGKQYLIQVSDTGKDGDWKTVYTQNTGRGATENLSFQTVAARYVRMQGVKRATQYGYSLFEFEIYGPKLSFDQQPQPQTVQVGQSAHFSVSVIGAPNLSYTWFRNGQQVAVTANPSYDTPATTLDDNGAQYGVVADDGNSNVTSTPAKLTVTPVTVGGGSGNSAVPPKGGAGGANAPAATDDGTIPDYPIYPNQIGVELRNNTNGAYRDDQIYVAVIAHDPAKNGQFVYLKPDGTTVLMSDTDNDAPGHLTKGGKNYSNYFFTLAQAKQLKFPKLFGARAFVALGSPLYIRTLKDAANQIGFAGPDVRNPTDPNIDVYFDWYEFTYGDNGLWLNNTQVDQFGFPLTEDVYGSNRTTHVRSGITESRASIFAAYQKEVPPEFLPTNPSPYRIMAPSKGGFDAGQPNGKYFDAYIDSMWEYYRTHTLTLLMWGNARKFVGQTVGDQLVFTEIDQGNGAFVGGKYYVNHPNTQDMLEAKGPLASGNATELAIEAQVAAALNRHIMEDDTQWAAPSSAWYAKGPYNAYAKFWHDHSIDRKAYGFSYDDVADQSSTLVSATPEHVVLGIGF
ncbi:beta-1,3-glucanase family protein [Pandoraea anhela]|uniref:beta-1,3-glucanase family protein n=1 Tax=Pandoraea anhela TaxID=2508295 RepID=UPI001FE84A64|nr:beta-1,3-glucanase family protein [Pandoraea anhela]